MCSRSERQGPLGHWGHSTVARLEAVRVLRLLAHEARGRGLEIGVNGNMAS